MSRSSVYNIIRQILDTLFPPQERVKQVRKLKSDELDRLPAERSLEKGFISAVCDYRQPAVRQVVKAAKYDGDRHPISLMAKLMKEEMLTLCEERRIFADKIVITPVPLSAHRRREYGFNHSWRLACKIEQIDDNNTFSAQKLLRKVRATPAQTSLSKKERLQNLADSFSAKPTNEELVIIIDDVTTTGATFAEAKRAIKQSSDTKVLALAFAH